MKLFKMEIFIIQMWITGTVRRCLLKQMYCWNKNIKFGRCSYMKKSLKNALLIMLVTGLCLSTVGIATADPTYDYDGITVEPAEPERLSEVTFSVEITGEVIEEVCIRVQECMDTEEGEQCYLDVQNTSMTKSDGNTWTCTTELVWESTTIGHCWLEIKSSGTWYDYAPNKGYDSTDFSVVSAEDGGDGNGADGGDGTDDTGGGTPGFELILVVISLVVALSIYKRKRK